MKASVALFVQTPPQVLMYRVSPFAQAGRIIFGAAISPATAAVDLINVRRRIGVILLELVIFAMICHPVLPLFKVIRYLSVSYRYTESFRNQLRRKNDYSLFWQLTSHSSSAMQNGFNEVPEQREHRIGWCFLPHICKAFHCTAYRCLIKAGSNDTIRNHDQSANRRHIAGTLYQP